MGRKWPSTGYSCWFYRLQLRPTASVAPKMINSFFSLSILSALNLSAGADRQLKCQDARWKEWSRWKQVYNEAWGLAVASHVWTQIYTRTTSICCRRWRFIKLFKQIWNTTVGIYIIIFANFNTSYLWNNKYSLYYDVPAKLCYKKINFFKNHLALLRTSISSLLGQCCASMLQPLAAPFVFLWTLQKKYIH